jgi:hypothetical protein
MAPLVAPIGNAAGYGPKQNPLASLNHVAAISNTAASDPITIHP